MHFSESVLGKIEDSQLTFHCNCLLNSFVFSIFFAKVIYFLFIIFIFLKFLLTDNYTEGGRSTTSTTTSRPEFRGERDFRRSNEGQDNNQTNVGGQRDDTDFGRGGEGRA